MAKKTSSSSKAGTTIIEDAGSVILVPLKRIVVNEAIAAREGAPDAEKVMQFAENFIERRNSGRPHQLSPALVRSEDGESFELIDGRHRLEACKQASEATGESFMLLCRVVQSDDEQGLVDAIQSNEFREDPNDFDRAASIEKLIALGKTQAECAVIFGLHPSSISQIRAVGKLDKKYRTAIENGDIDRDSAIFIAGLDGDETARNEVFEECMRHKQRFAQLEASLETKRLRREAEEKVTEAKASVDQHKTVAKAKGEERKAIEKDLKEVTSSAAKTKEVDELIKIREKEAKLKAEVDALAKQEALAAKEAEKASKLLEKAKLDKEKVKEQTAVKKPVTQEDAKNVAKEKGLTAKGSPKSAKQLKVEFEAMTSDENDPMECEAAIALMGKLEAFIDGEITTKQLRNAFVYNCKTDEQLSAQKLKAKAKK